MVRELEQGLPTTTVRARPQSVTPAKTTGEQNQAARNLLIDEGSNVLPVKRRILWLAFSPKD
jgi:hypothetical protein